MKIYRVDIKETKTGWIHVPATSKEDARKKAEERVWENDYEIQNRRIKLEAEEAEERF